MSIPQSVAPLCDEARLRDCLRIGLAAIRARYPGFPTGDAEDIVQELAVAYLEDPLRVRVPEAWFFACAVRRAERFLRGRRRSAPLHKGLPAADPDWESRFVAWRLLLTLRPESRALLCRLFIAGFSAREIAAAKGCTPQAIYLRAAKDLKRLLARARPRTQSRG